MTDQHQNVLTGGAGSAGGLYGAYNSARRTDQAIAPAQRQNAEPHIIGAIL